MYRNSYITIEFASWIKGGAKFFIFIHPLSDVALWEFDIIDPLSDVNMCFLYYQQSYVNLGTSLTKEIGHSLNRYVTLVDPTLIILSSISISFICRMFGIASLCLICTHLFTFRPSLMLNLSTTSSIETQRILAW